MFYDGSSIKVAKSYEATGAKTFVEVDAICMNQNSTSKRKKSIIQLKILFHECSGTTVVVQDERQ